MNKEEKELEKKYDEYYDNYDLYMMRYILPEIYSHQLASYYYRGLMVDASLEQYVGSIGEVFNLKYDFGSVKDAVEEILKIKYNLIITNEDPLTMKYWK